MKSGEGTEVTGEPAKDVAQVSGAVDAPRRKQPSGDSEWTSQSNTHDFHNQNNLIYLCRLRFFFRTLSLSLSLCARASVVSPK